MRRLWILLLLFTHVQATTEKGLVDLYIDLAQKVELKDLQGKKSKFECRFAALHTDPSIIAHAKKLDEAVQRLQLICLKSQCEKLGELAQAGMDDLNAMTESEFRDFLEFQGKTPEEIDKALLNRKAALSLRSMTCENAPDGYRSFVFHSCFSTPVECH